jgi:hypothetical protein
MLVDILQQRVTMEVLLQVQTINGHLVVEEVLLQQ